MVVCPATIITDEMLEIVERFDFISVGSLKLAEFDQGRFDKCLWAE